MASQVSLYRDARISDRVEKPIRPGKLIRVMHRALAGGDADLRQRLT
jgi:hypothetical protein